MASTYVYPSGTSAAAWTPSSGGGNHHLLLDDAYPPGSTADYIQATGLAAGIEKLQVPTGPADVDRIRYVVLNPYTAYGSTISVIPAVSMSLVLNGVVVQTVFADVENAGVWTAYYATFGPFNILGADWRNMTRELWIEPCPGGGISKGDEEEPTVE